MPRWLFLLAQIRRQLWLRVALYSLLGVVMALVAVLLAPWVPEDFALTVGTSAVDDVLTILASSMLTVATFSLAVFVAAYTSISAAASPRAAALLISDGRGHGALATFVGAFIFAIVGLFALQTGYYGEQGRVIVFVFTVGVLGAVLVALLRWIDQLSRMGRVDEAVDRVAEATLAAFDGPFARSRLPAVRPDNGPTTEIPAGAVGYIQNVDLERLEALAEEFGAIIHVEALPGDFVHQTRPLLRVAAQANLHTQANGRLKACWVIGERRTFDQDPRFGMTVLGEIASRALSASVNDPGTALDVIATAVRLLTQWTSNGQPAETPAAARVQFYGVAARDLLDDVFAPIALYGAGAPSVALALQDAFGALAGLGDPELATAARLHSRLARKRALAGLQLEEDRARVRRAGRPTARPMS